MTFFYNFNWIFNTSFWMWFLLHFVWCFSTIISSSWLTFCRFTGWWWLLHWAFCCFSYSFSCSFLLIPCIHPFSRCRFPCFWICFTTSRSVSWASRCFSSTTGRGLSCRFTSTRNCSTLTTLCCFTSRRNQNWRSGSFSLHWRWFFDIVISIKRLRIFSLHTLSFSFQMLFSFSRVFGQFITWFIFHFWSRVHNIIEYWILKKFKFKFLVSILNISNHLKIIELFGSSFHLVMTKIMSIIVNTFWLVALTISICIFKFVLHSICFMNMPTIVLVFPFRLISVHFRFKSFRFQKQKRPQMKKKHTENAVRENLFLSIGNREATIQKVFFPFCKPNNKQKKKLKWLAVFSPNEIHLKLIR